LRARLRILKRPMVWGSAAAVLLSIFLCYEYWKHRDDIGTTSRRPSSSRVASLENSPDTQLSPEDSAIGVDIDTLPLLLAPPNPPADNFDTADADTLGSEAAQTRGLSLSPLASAPANRGDATNQLPTSPATQGLSLLSNPPSSQEPSNSVNPFYPNSFSVNTSNRGGLLGLTLPSTSSPPSSQFDPALLPSIGVPTVVGTGSSASGQVSPAAPANPLQTAVERYAPTPAGSQPTADQASSSQPLTTSQPVFSTPIQTAPGQVTPVSPPLQTSPPLGSTGYTLPPTLRTVPSSAPTGNVSPNRVYADSFNPQLQGLPTAPQIAPSTQLVQPGGIGQSSLPGQNFGRSQGVGASSQFAPGAVPQVEVQQPPPPFSSSGSNPGRYIGNGQINTFSSPIPNQRIGGGEINTFSNP
jgi:hypothetical protein